MKRNNLNFYPCRFLMYSRWNHCYDKTIISLLAFLFFVLSMDSIYSQSKIDVLGFAKGDSVIIISGIAPQSDEAINFYRKNSSGLFVLLNTDGPVKPVTDGEEIKKIFGNNWADVVSTLSIKDPSDIVYLISENEYNFFVMALKFPEIFRIAGCWFVDRTAESKNEVEYKLEYLDKNKAVKKSVTKKIRLKESQPVPPSALTAEIKDESIFLKWDYPKWKSDFSDLTTQFFVYRKSPAEDFKKINRGLIIRSDSNPPVYFDNDIASGVEYTYYITAVDIVSMESNPSQSVKVMWTDVKPPAIPDEIKADSVEGSIGISWKMNLELDAKGYSVYRSTKLEKDFVKLNQELIPIDKTYFYDKAFTFGAQYFYRITCSDKNGNESERSNPLSIVYEDLVPPDPPTNLTYKYVNKLIKLSWTASKSADVEGYHFYRGESNDVIPRITAEVIQSLTYTDSGYIGKGFAPGQRYTVAITAFDKGRNESQKVFIEDILIPDDDPPKPPEGLMTEIKNGNSVEISCGGSTSPDVAVYKLFRTGLGSGDKPIELASYKDTPFFMNDTTAEKTKAYIYYSIAIDSAGNESAKGNIDTVLVKDDIPPPSPRLVEAQSAQEGILITWEPVYEFDFAGYNVYKSNIPDGIFVKINKVVITELRYLDKEGKLTDFYKVRAIDTSGNESTKGDYASPN
ncbi:MAG: hypothetical protein AB9882_12005 [Ignavibacteriaceae bacterium]